MNGVKAGNLPGGVWHVEYIEGAGVIDRSPARFQFDANTMQISGNASCNSFTGTYQLIDGALVMGNLASTRMLCTPAQMEQEQRFLKAMKKVHSWKVQNGLLHLNDKQGDELFRGALWAEPQS